jgi:hypothetical protein
MKTAHYRSRLPLIKFLRLLCAIGEVATAIGLAFVVALIPLSEAKVAAGRESVAIYVPSGTFHLVFNVRFSSPSDSFQGYNAMPAGPGSMSFGPVRLRAPKDERPQDISFRDMEGSVSILKPDDAAKALAFLEWPFVSTLLFTSAVTVTLLELFRRMLRSVEEREVFTDANIRNLYKIGILLIFSGIVRLLLAGWLVSRMVAFVTQHFATQGMALESSSGGNLSAVLPGLMIIALAEVFRHGLALKEDSQLTI